MSRRILTLLALTLLTIAATPNFAAVISRGEALADACTSCHGVRGRSRGSIPSLNVLSRDQFVAAMQAFRDEQRPATVMNRIARPYTDSEFQLLAEYFTEAANK